MRRRGRRVFGTQMIPILEFDGESEERHLTISTPRDVPSTTARKSNGLNGSPFHRHGQMCGFAPRRMVTSRRQDAMREGESSIGITPTGANSGTKTSSTT